MLEEQAVDQPPEISVDIIKGLKPYCLWLHPYLSEFL
jgi:hypothetical protein